jgi:urea transport system permease protein
MKQLKPYPFVGLALLALLLLVIMPLVLDIFRLNLMGKYLTYAFVAWAWCWGYSGILSLGQGVFLAWRILHGDVSEAGGIDPADTRMQPHRGSLTSWTGTS